MDFVGGGAERAFARSARVLIEPQLDAFSRDDAAGDYAEASPQVKALFHDPDTFMERVRRG